MPCGTLCSHSYKPAGHLRVAKSYGVTNSFVPDKLRAMLREFSAGGVVVRRATVGWELAVIEPQREEGNASQSGKSDKKRHK